MKNLIRMVKRAASLQKETGVRLLWGTANLFSHPRYTHGAATNPDPLVFAHAAAQVRRALDATVELGGSGYVFWGGREGYTTLLNTDVKQEREQMAAFLHLAADYAREAGFTGTLLIEPKPMEPTTHQYDFDAATTLGFLREFDLFDRFMLNIEANHATSRPTPSSTISSSPRSRAGSGASTSTVATPTSAGTPISSPPTSRAPPWPCSSSSARAGSRDGGLNFDAKAAPRLLRRRRSLPRPHRRHGRLRPRAPRRRPDDATTASSIERLAERYAPFRETEMGKKILKRRTSLPELEAGAAAAGEPERVSGRQEALENLVNDYLYATRID